MMLRLNAFSLFMRESCEETDNPLRLHSYSHVRAETNSGDNRLSDIPGDQWTRQVNG